MDELEKERVNDGWRSKFINSVSVVHSVSVSEPFSACHSTPHSVYHVISIQLNTVLRCSVDQAGR